MMDHKYSESGFDATFNKKECIKYGIILGIISLVLGLIVLFVTKNIQSFWLLTSLSFGVNTILYVLISLYFSYKLRAFNGGYWNFSIALKSTFLMLVIATVIATLTTTIYVHLINPSLQEEVLRNTINVTIEQLENSGAPDDVIDSRVATLEEQMDTLGQLKFSDAIRGLFIAILMQFIFSLFLAAITKNERFVSKPLNNNQPN